MKLLFITNIPSPYRVDFFNELGKRCTLDVIFERSASDERDESWKEFQFTHFRGIILKGLRFGRDKAITWRILPYLRREYDHIIVANAATPVGILAICYLKWKRKEYYIEGDGGQYIQRKGLKEKLKRFIIGGAAGCFSTSRELDHYYQMYGARADRIYRYPFSSIYASEIQEMHGRQEKRAAARTELGISMERKMVLAIGRYDHGKGFDLLIRSAAALENDADIYIVGGKVTDEYEKLAAESHAVNVVFVDFLRKKELSRYLLAADIFVLPTRHDAWGLVINEAMAYGLPIISTDKCVAALELIEEGVNGYVVPTDNVTALENRMRKLLEDDVLLEEMAGKNLKKIKGYTIEAMAERHMEILEEGIRKG